MTSSTSSQTSLPVASKRVPRVAPEITIGKIQTLLVTHSRAFDSLNYVYIVNSKNILIGAVSLKEVFTTSKSIPVREVMKKNLTTLHPQQPKERAVYLALKHGLKGIPVVDDEGVFLGAVTSDTITATAHHELHDDFYHIAGVPHHPTPLSTDDVLKLPILTLLKHRLPWLILGLGGGLATAGIVNGFEVILKDNLILAAFIPLIVYMSDAVGTQMEAFIVRDLAIRRRLRFHRYFLRQLHIVLIIGMISSLLLYGFSLLVYDNIRIALVLGLALLAAIVSSVFSGLIIPYLFSRLHQDPANASGPVATILQDITSVLIYFLIASSLL